MFLRCENEVARACCRTAAFLKYTEYTAYLVFTFRKKNVMLIYLSKAEETIVQSKWKKDNKGKTSERNITETEI